MHQRRILTTNYTFSHFQHSWVQTYKHEGGGNVVGLHTMKFIQPHLLSLDLTVERRKLLRHAAQRTKTSLYLSELGWMELNQDIFLKTYMKTNSSSSRMETSDRNPLSSLLFILSLGMDFSRQQTLLFHLLLTWLGWNKKYGYHQCIIGWVRTGHQQ